MSERRYLPVIEDEQVARAVARLQNHSDMQVFLKWVETDAREYAILKFRGKQDHDVLLKWSTVLQVLEDLIATHRGAHENWARISEAKKKTSDKWRD